MTAKRKAGRDWYRSASRAVREVIHKWDSHELIAGGAPRVLTMTALTRSPMPCSCSMLYLYSARLGWFRRDWIVPSIPRWIPWDVRKLVFKNPWD